MDAVKDSSRWPAQSPVAIKLPEPPGPIVQFDDPVGFEWNRYVLPIANLPAALAGLRIVHLSDIHARFTWKRAYDDLNDRLAGDPPDLVLFTGDLVEPRYRPGKAVGIGQRLVRGWQSKLGTFGIRGNHDLRLPLSRFNNSRLRYMEGECLRVERDGASIELIGLPGPDHDDLSDDFCCHMPARQVGVPRIVLSHYPDHIRRCRSLQADIFLVGHTHGGQCCLPGLIPIIRHDGLWWKYTRGVHRLMDQWLVVSRGFGFSLMPIRVLCPAEVIELILVPGPGGLTAATEQAKLNGIRE